jgi:group I intron endonuclease
MTDFTDDFVHRGAGIYQITCLPTGKRYVGSSVNVSNRWSQHKTDLRAGRHPNPYLQRAWKRHGQKAFVIKVLEFVGLSVKLLSPDVVLQLKAAEERWLTEAKPEFNINPRADAPMRGVKMTAAHKAKISKALKGRVSNRKGATMSVEARAKISASLFGNTFKRGKPAAESTKAKMRISQAVRRLRESKDVR